MTDHDLERWLSQLRKGSLEMVVLATLSGERLYGLEILGRLETLGVSEGTLYPLLNRLRKEGQLESEWETRESGHPRRYYRLTESGRARAEAMARRWREYNHQLDELMRPLLEGGSR
ncbi:MAG: helix-turn-helix transcriptional regulator [Thermoanaerobaculia bacterium]|nr:helix-turn-helix transcriptional regulator [Thermoanaerobaculia bacterium]